jgi:hypothetical protein
MSFCIYNEKLGYYQDSRDGLLFWSEVSGTPELGIFKFNTKAEAKDIVTLFKDMLHGLEFEVKEYSIYENLQLITVGETINRAMRVMPWGKA